jgi:hypothetical protein
MLNIPLPMMLTIEKRHDRSIEYWNTTRFGRASSRNRVIPSGGIRCRQIGQTSSLSFPVSFMFSR